MFTTLRWDFFFFDARSHGGHYALDLWDPYTMWYHFIELHIQKYFEDMYKNLEHILDHHISSIDEFLPLWIFMDTLETIVGIWLHHLVFDNEGVIFHAMDIYYSLKGLSRTTSCQLIQFCPNKSTMSCKNNHPCE